MTIEDKLEDLTCEHIVSESFMSEDAKAVDVSDLIGQLNNLMLNVSNMAIVTDYNNAMRRSCVRNGKLGRNFDANNILDDVVKPVALEIKYTDDKVLA